MTIEQMLINITERIERHEAMLRDMPKSIAQELRRAEAMDGDADYLVSLPYAEQQKILRMRREQK